MIVFSPAVETTAALAVAAAKAARKPAVITVSGFTVNGTSPRRYSRDDESPNGEAPHLRGLGYRTDKWRLQAIARVLATVVVAELVAIALVPVPLLVELGRVLDLLLRQSDEEGLGVRIDVADHARRNHHFLAEDPRARVDDDEAAAGLVGRFVHLADVTVTSLDLEPCQVELREIHGWGRRDVEFP